MERSTPSDDLAARARDWHHARHAAVCDVIEPWEHGTVVRAPGYPTYWDYNLIRVERDPGMSADELIALAEEMLGAAGLAHRRIDVDVADVAEALRPDFKARGWHTLRLLFMHHEGARGEGPGVEIKEVPYDAVDDLRLVWHHEDFPDQPNDHHADAREVALARGARIFAVHDAGAPAAFAQIEYAGDAAEITQVFVHPERRGAGMGTALTATAIGAAGSVSDLWIAADDEDRPKELYGRLGFQPAWTSMELTRFPPSEGSDQA